MAINRPWRDRILTYGFFPTVQTVGTNYLELCERSKPNSDAQRAAVGIRDVLAGRRDEFRFEYESEVRDAERWFRMTARRLDNSGHELGLVEHEALDESAESQRSLFFEDLFGQMSRALVRVTADGIDAELDSWLERIGIKLELDRVSLGRVNLSDGDMYLTNRWAREGVFPLPLNANLSKLVPNQTARVMSGAMFSNSRVEDWSAAVNEDRQFMQSQGWGEREVPASNVAIPLMVEGQVVGVLIFAKVIEHRNWSPRMIRRLRVIAELFASALERQRAVDESRRLSAEMRHISRVAMMGEMTASLAHELNQPLGAVLNNARAARRLLAAKRPDLVEIGSALDDIVRDNSRAVETIRQLRALFQRGDMKMLPVGIQGIFRDVDRMVSIDASARKIRLRVDVPTTEPVVVGDRTQLTQAVLNLVTNAFDSVCETADQPREVVLRAIQQSDGRVHVSVSDSGKGIDAKIMPRLFEPFFTTKSTGMGMGLAIVRTIVETHGGRLWATQNLDRGATLEFELPAASIST